MLGLIFREHAKPKRSIRAWRAGDNSGTLPMHSGDLGTPKSVGSGFGSQGEKQAGLRGTCQRLIRNRRMLTRIRALQDS